MRNTFLVRSPHLNHQGHLFGGELMAEIDTVAYCLIRERYPDNSFVTRAAEIGFERPANLGDIILFDAVILKVGTSSVQVEVTGAVQGTRICRAVMVYVNIGPDGRKKAL